MTLTDDQASFVSEARTATLGTIAENGRPRLVPICFVLEGEVLYTPIDEKPKQATDPRSLARIRDIERRADVTLLIDRWDEDWDHLAWLRIEGRARLTDDHAERDPAIAALRAKYPQYAGHDLESRPLIRIAIERVRSWATSAIQEDRVPRRAKAVGRAHRLEITARVEQGHDVALGDRRHRVVLGEHVAGLVDVPGDVDDLGPGESTAATGRISWR